MNQKRLIKAEMEVSAEDVLYEYVVDQHLAAQGLTWARVRIDSPVGIHEKTRVTSVHLQKLFRFFVDKHISEGAAWCLAVAQTIYMPELWLLFKYPATEDVDLLQLQQALHTNWIEFKVEEIASPEENSETRIYVLSLAANYTDMDKSQFSTRGKVLILRTGNKYKSIGLRGYDSEIEQSWESILEILKDTPYVQHFKSSSES